MNPDRKAIQEEDRELLDALVESINGELQAVAGARCFELYRALERYMAAETYFRCPLDVRTTDDVQSGSVLYSDYIVWGGWEVSLELTADEFPELAELDERLSTIKHHGLHAVADYIASLPDETGR